ncbi:MurR/RpiR family transcriptional regulator [Acutalibacter muris]|uniref:MurR/RpiR family transcriptional regulator n=1 Tax=Acutalibacter muris TaxID=1796620 RepID=A0AA92L695_9FIRM|nr:MurR/RpiR family transcriptional regulator [Acutalibacter muris]QQR29318.1 MurR/RpiR family transcriptional regulator [Acutalibacter muris]
MAGIVLKLNEIMDSLPASEQKIAVYLISNLNDVVGISVEELAGRSDSSQAAVVRFCKKLGYRGYREFSLKLASELAVARQSQDRECSDIKIGDRAGNVIQSVCQHNMRAIEDTSTLIDPDQVELAAGKLFDARRVDVYAVAASHLAALDAQQKLVRIGKQVSAYSDPHLQLSSAALLGPEDVVLALSWSGEAREVLRACEAARRAGAFIISISRLGPVSLSSYSDVHFGLSAPEPSLSSGAMSSRIAQMTMVDILFSCLISRYYNETAPYLERARQVAQYVRA